jgi:chromosomal replication initiator protein
VEKHTSYSQVSPTQKNSQETTDLGPALVWSQISQILSKELSESSFKTWFSPVHCLEITEASVVLSVPDNYYGQWLKDHYQNLISSAVNETLGGQRKVTYQVVAPPKAVEAKSSKPSEKNTSATVQTNLSQLNTNYDFDGFVIGPGNRFAHAAAYAVAEAPARQYNPLFIYGPVGLGKTHLMQAIAHEINRRNPSAKVLYISSEKFTNQLITSIQTKSTQQFRAKYRNVDLLLIDDIHFIAGKEATQEEFFHTFNTLYDAHKQIVVTSDRSPKEIPGLEERLVSRFGWGLVTDIQPPDFETRVAILKKKMEKETVVVPDDVCYFIASKIRSNIRELEGALIRVVAYCTLTGQTVDLKRAQEVLRDSLKEEEQNISMERIQRVVADFFNIKVSDLRAKRRSRSIAHPRHIAMFLIRSLTSHSLPEIGEYFGGRDHTTVLHAFNKINEEIEQKVETRRSVDEIKELLKKTA